MPKSHDELATALDALARDAASQAAALENDEFWRWFSPASAEIAEQAAASDREYVRERIERLLSEIGKEPDEGDDSADAADIEAEM